MIHLTLLSLGHKFTIVAWKPERSNMAELTLTIDIHQVLNGISHSFKKRLLLLFEKIDMSVAEEVGKDLDGMKPSAIVQPLSRSSGQSAATNSQNKDANKLVRVID